jgi:uncharacterized protein (UPF0216 family)
LTEVDNLEKFVDASDLDVGLVAEEDDKMDADVEPDPDIAEIEITEVDAMEIIADVDVAVEEKVFGVKNEEEEVDITNLYLNNLCRPLLSAAEEVELAAIVSLTIK